MASSRFEDATGVKPELIGKSLTAAKKARGVRERESYLCEAAGANLVVFSFPGSFTAGDWFAPTNQESFGEAKIDRDQFPSLRSIANDVDAAVNEAFLVKLGALLHTSRSSFQDKVRKAVEQGKKIVFTGHSSGGATAILATVWFLETYLRQEPLCVTFGSPLVGDHVFKHALGRENWARFFLHFVTRYDVVPRFMLAPKSSIAQTLPQILHLLDPTSDTTLPLSDPMVPEFYMTVVRNASAVASQIACQHMGNTNPLLETLSAFVELSPYRPFGTYVFCANGRLVVVNNADAVLQVLFHSSQCGEGEWPHVAYQSIRDHQNYERELRGSFDAYRLDDQFPVSSDGVDFDANSTGTIFSDVGLSIRGRLSVGAAIEVEKQRAKNQESILGDRLGKIKEKLEWTEKDYKKPGDAHRRGYYDSFKASNEETDFEANVKRAELAGMYDEVVEMLKKNQLPDGFEGLAEWIELATRYRRLIEPLDIANYYRHLKNEDTGPYMEKGRPTRYKCAQRWLEYRQWKSTGTNPENSYWDKVRALNLGPVQDIEKELKTAGSKSDSCFWAEVEELSGKPYEGIKVRAKTLETMLEGWIEGEAIDKHMFQEGSTFHKWWNKLPEHHKSQSPIRRFMQS